MKEIKAYLGDDGNLYLTLGAAKDADAKAALKKLIEEKVTYFAEQKIVHEFILQNKKELWKILNEVDLTSTEG